MPHGISDLGKPKIYNLQKLQSIYAQPQAQVSPLATAYNNYATLPQAYTQSQQQLSISPLVQPVMQQQLQQQQMSPQPVMQTPPHAAQFVAAQQPQQDQHPLYRPSAHIYQQLPKAPSPQPQHPFSLQTQTTPSSSMSGGQTFRLHSETEPPSRLDPALELNRNLTNWGMTYRAGVQQPRSTPRRTWDSEMWANAMQVACVPFELMR